MERQFKHDCWLLCRCHWNGSMGISQALRMATLWIAAVCWGLWESRTGPAGCLVCLSGRNPPHSEWERQEELNFSQLLLWRWEPAAALSASHKVFSQHSSTVWHFFLPFCTFSPDWKTCCFSQNTAKTSSCDMLTPFKCRAITGNIAPKMLGTVSFHWSCYLAFFKATRLSWKN